MQNSSFESVIDCILSFYEFQLPFYEKSVAMLEFSLMLEEYFEISISPDKIIGLDKREIMHMVCTFNSNNSIVS